MSNEKILNALLNSCKEKILTNSIIKAYNYLCCLEVIFLNLKWNVSELNKLRSTGLSFDETVDVNVIKKMNDEVREVSPVQVKGRADFGSNKVTFDLSIKGKMILPCSRTLVDVEFPFDIQSKETFVLTPQEYEDQDEDLHEPEGDVIDLMPYIRENILVEIPMQIFSEDENAEGKAPQSGDGWEVITEEEKKEQIDPRLAKLKNFFNEEK